LISRCILDWISWLALAIRSSRSPFTSSLPFATLTAVQFLGPSEGAAVSG